MRNPFDRSGDDRPERSSGGSARTPQATGRGSRPETPPASPSKSPSGSHAGSLPGAPPQAQRDAAVTIPRQRTADDPPAAAGAGADVRVAGPPPTPAPGPAGTHDAIGPADGTTEDATAPESRPAGAAEASEQGSWTHLVDPAAAERLRSRWRDVQAGFVDDPRDSVRQAQGLITDALTALSDAVQARARELTDGDGSRDQGGNEGRDGGADTERLRRMLREQRDLLHRLVGP